ncbi:hypothetical protein MHBO_000411 [Bonamia ostreae]|uniref:CB1 cannabinoid receptor-interacting protein 1 n=1 Tax=Bonamia ostreae TaxID=126728 RepID=A0ABV2AGC5_9EUKA
MDNGHNKMKVKNLWQNGQNFEFEIEVVQKSTENILLAKGGGKYKPGNSPKFQKTVNLDKCLDDETKSLVVKTTLYRKGYSKNVNDENYDEALIVKNFEMVKFRFRY